MEIKQLLKNIVREKSISDIHMTVNRKPIVRDTGQLREFIRYPEPLSYDEMKIIATELMDEDQWKLFKKEGELDFAYSIPGFCRFRVNAYHQRGAISLALRIIPRDIPTIDDLGLPVVLKKLALQRSGLILCTGATGSGKSTTLAAMIDEINEKKKSHILTLEDPIEYLHKHKKSIVHQREIGIDTLSFANGLRAALRQDPDIILVGEMRDLETISTALEAAETGHLVLATLHTDGAAKTIDRIVDVFPSVQQQQVRIQLASTLSGIISQQLLARADKAGMVAALEILLGTLAAKNIIREGKSSQLESVMQTGQKYGMITMNNYLLKLYENGLITMEDIIIRSTNPDYIKKKLGRLS